MEAKDTARTNKALTTFGNMIQVSLYFCDRYSDSSDNKTWEAVKPASEKKPSGVIYHSAVVHDTEMIVCCGFTEKKPINDVWSYDFGKFVSYQNYLQD